MILVEYTNETPARERRRAARVLRARMRRRVDAFAAWWADFGRALVPFALAFVALLPMAALVVWAAIEVTS